MALSSTYLIFNVYGGTGIGGTPLYTHSVANSATYFRIQQWDRYCANTYAGFTVGEEVKVIADPTTAFPRWNSGYAYTYEGSTLVNTSSWTTFVTSNQSSGYPPAPPTPQNYYMDFPYSYFVRLDNLAFWISYPFDSVSVPPGGGYNDQYGSLNSNGPTSGFPLQVCTGTGCPYTMGCTTPTWVLTATAGVYFSYVPVTSQFYDITMSSSAPVGWEYSGCTVTVTSTTPNEVSSFVFYTYVS